MQREKDLAPDCPNPARAITEDSMKPGQWFARPDDTIVYKLTPKETQAINARREEVNKERRSEFQTLCMHNPPHLIDIYVGDEEQLFREWLRRSGWYDQGYCEAYYPLYLRDTFRANVGPLPDTDILDEEYIG